ncbi:MAG TPA: MBL fold metallo-hydrolase [Desulfuromonadales bacterium]|nr:MBL fold metallo-hydrolase [Desulfuromonadales bacterium]
MTARPFHTLEPTFFAGLFDDPVLWVRVNPTGRALLVDCGQIHHLAKRVLRAVDTLLISHAHMDHFMGIDTFIRHAHVAPRTFEIFGPPGLSTRLTHKLAGYDWNLAETFWCSLRVREIFPDHTVSYLLPGAEGFRCRKEGEEARDGAAILRTPQLTVSAALCDHHIPVLVFRIDERPAFAIDAERLSAEGLVAGPWLKELKRQVLRSELRGSLAVLRRRGDATEAGTAPDAAALYAAIRRQRPPSGIGYLTDVGFTPENLTQLRSLLDGVTLLICECSFLAADRDKARASAHLCTSDVNRLAAELTPAFLLPMHLSKTYLRHPERLFAELSVPAATTLLRLPPHVPPRPLLPTEVPPLFR